MRDVILIAHDIRSCHNVGSLLRTAEGFGASKMFMTGYTPYPLTDNDTRLPYIAEKLHKQISKTALGAETLLPWEHQDNIEPLLDELKAQGYTIVGLEQSKTSVMLPDFNPPAKMVLLLGREVEGIDESLLKRCDTLIEIPMKGKKESFNVVQAAAVALYHSTLLNL